jgi:hypothetical protein
MQFAAFMGALRDLGVRKGCGWESMMYQVHSWLADHVVCLMLQFKSLP